MTTDNNGEAKRLGWSYGGQALMEGVMMRGAYTAAIAVRHPDGHIVIKTEPLSSIYRGTISKIPFLRGVPMLWDALGLGMRALFFSAEIQGKAEDPEFTMSGGAGWATGVLSLALGFGLFMVVPSLVAGWLIPERALLFNLVEGAVRLLILVGYMASVGRIPEIARVFAYHGAEHKTINAHEAGAPLTVEGVRPFATSHARCGTAFLLFVVLISILIFAPLGRPVWWLRIISRLVMLPVIAGIAYEILRLAGRFSHWGWVKLLIAPNLALQRLTTREPDDGMVEVAVAALRAVLDGEQQAGAEFKGFLPAAAAAGKNPL